MTYKNGQLVASGLQVVHQHCQIMYAHEIKIFFIISKGKKPVLNLDLTVSVAALLKLALNVLSAYYRLFVLILLLEWESRMKMNELFIF